MFGQELAHSYFGIKPDFVHGTARGELASGRASADVHADRALKELDHIEKSKIVLDEQETAAGAAPGLDPAPSCEGSYHFGRILPGD